MEAKIERILEIGCPLLQAVAMIDMMVDFRYRARRHEWTVSEKIVKRNLRDRLELDLRWYGHAAISDQFFDYFELIPEEWN